MLILYPVMAIVWLWARQIPLAILPFTVYSTFHVLTYVRANLIPTISPPPAGSAAGTKPKSALADAIGKFVKEYYDSSMTLVAILEIALWFRVLGSALLFQSGSWILLALYTVFFRARFAQSSFVQSAIAQLTARADATLAQQSTPPAVRQGWEAFKGIARQAVDATNLEKYISGSAPGQAPGSKKAQ
jgi:transmembrane protein 33